MLSLKRSKIRASFLWITLLLACSSANSAKSEQPSRGHSHAPIENAENGPHIRLVLLDEEDNEKTCSGIILSPNRILTAAHCFDEFVFDGFALWQQERIRIEKVILHPRAKELSKSEYQNDLAIAELERSLHASIATDIASKIPAAGQKVAIYGFGSGTVDSALGGTLRRSEMTIANVDEHFIRAHFDGTGGNTCFGDSGGAVLIERGTDSTIVGIVSSGTREDCSPGDTSVFVNLGSASARQFLKAALSPHPQLESDLAPEYRNLRAIPLKPEQ